MSIDSLMTTSITLQRETAVKDSSGGLGHTWANVVGYTAVPATIQSAGANLRERYSQLNLFVTDTAYIPQDIGVRTGDRIIDADNSTYMVHGYSECTAGYNQAWQIDMEKQLA